MQLMRLKTLCAVLCALWVNCSFGQQTPYLEKPVTIKYATLSYAELFRQLAQQTGVVFSYAQTFDDNRKVTVQYYKKPLRIVLNAVVNESGCTYRMKGKYVILTCKPVTKSEAPVVSTDISLNGYIFNVYDSTAVHETSVYLRQNRQSAVTDQYGYFTMHFPHQGDVLSISIAREGYRDTTISILARSRNSLVVYLEPLPKLPIVKNDTMTVYNEPVSDTIIAEEEEVESFRLWSRLQALKPNLRNIKDTLFTHVSFSLVPPISTNHLLSLNTVNDYSFNILVGASKGVNMMEIGGLVNLDAGDVSYLQLAGCANLVSGDVRGFQGSGLVNLVDGNLNGVQVAGLVNINHGTVRQAQLGGIGNVSGSTTEAVQVGGIFNFSKGHLKGAQIAGISNIANGFEGSQVSGFANNAFALGEGFQIAGFVNRADSLEGFQIAGFSNNARYINGCQISGFVNKARHVQGTQIGIFNFARTINGVPIGFFSFVTKGYHKIELSMDEQEQATASFRTGVNAFHNIFIGGMQTQGENRLWTIGYGIGSSLKLSRHWYLDFDLTSRQLGIAGSGNYEFNQLTKAAIGVDWRIWKHFSIAAGPTLNWLASDITGLDHDLILSRIQGTSLAETTDGDIYHRLWVGGYIALRFL